MLTHDETVALGLLPFTVRLEQLLPHSPVSVLWEFPVRHAGGLVLAVTARVDWVRWS